MSDDRDLTWRLPRRADGAPPCALCGGAATTTRRGRSRIVDTCAACSDEVDVLAAGFMRWSAQPDALED